MKPELLLPVGYRDAVLATNPVGYWPLGEANGTVARDVMGANHGTYVGSPILGVGGPLVGDPSTAVTFGGPPQKVVLGAPTTLPAGASDRTAAALVQTSSPAVGYWLWYGSLALSQSFAVGLSATGAIQVDRYGEQVAIGSGHADGIWHHVVVTLAGARLVTVFADGSAIGSGSFSADLNTVVSEFGLANFAGTGYWLGTIAHAAIWNRALTASEARALYDAGMGR